MADHDPLFHDDMPLGEARSVLRGLVDDGARCPCCTQLAKVYARKINSGQAAGLIRFYRNVGALRFAHLPTLGLSSLGGEFARLRFWELSGEVRVMVMGPPPAMATWSLGTIALPGICEKIWSLLGSPILRERLES
jgi:hypothetical protein